MSQHDPVSAAWRAHRAYLVDLAFRMVGDIGVAEDMVQEAFSACCGLRSATSTTSVAG